jgi:hypothetical protein
VHVQLDLQYMAAPPDTERWSATGPRVTSRRWHAPQAPLASPAAQQTACRSVGVCQAIPVSTTGFNHSQPDKGNRNQSLLSIGTSHFCRSASAPSSGLLQCSKPIPCFAISTCATSIQHEHPKGAKKCVVPLHMCSAPRQGICPHPPCDMPKICISVANVQRPLGTCPPAMIHPNTCQLHSCRGSLIPDQQLLSMV